MVVTVEAIMRDAKVLSPEDKNPYWTMGMHHVFISKVNQLLGTYDALTRFRSQNYEHYGAVSDWRSWEAHHIFEDRELDYLGVREKFPQKKNVYVY